jgi:hypothetical protein
MVNDDSKQSRANSGDLAVSSLPLVRLIVRFNARKVALQPTALHPELPQNYRRQYSVAVKLVKVPHGFLKRLPPKDTYFTMTFPDRPSIYETGFTLASERLRRPLGFVG